MAAETLIQVECAEACFWIANLLREIINPNNTNSKLPIIECNTDSHQLYDAVHSIKPIQDKRLQIDVSLLREMLEKKELSKINWIEKSMQLADCLTKTGSSADDLLRSFDIKTLPNY